METLDAVKKRSRWLNEYAKKVCSQFGEDGIVAKALSVVPNPTGWCVEFGAEYGQVASNTFNLVANHNYQAILIEADPKKFSKLKASYPHSDRAIFINALAGSLLTQTWIVFFGHTRYQKILTFCQSTSTEMTITSGKQFTLSDLVLC